MSNAKMKPRQEATAKIATLLQEAQALVEQAIQLANEHEIEFIVNLPSASAQLTYNGEHEQWANEDYWESSQICW